ECTEATRIATDLPVVIPPRNVKYAIAGLISHIALSLGEDLTKTEIRGLFDALSQEQQESERDSDFPEAADELNKIIDQECRFWSGAPVPREQ
ncbi:MAG: hypothetical protein JXD19_00425, partial [Deltaproteobacteria bacterium]|nr:hypothetical protein [Deltaproteobacteria bacterium]